MSTSLPKGGERIAWVIRFCYHRMPVTPQRSARTSVHPNAVIMRFILRAPASLPPRADSAQTQNHRVSPPEEAV